MVRLYYRDMSQSRGMLTGLWFSTSPQFRISHCSAILVAIEPEHFDLYSQPLDILLEPVYLFEQCNDITLRLRHQIVR